mgnify:CR=1 FL=1
MESTQTKSENTYKNKGLPPKPICIAGLNTIKIVLENLIDFQQQILRIGQQLDDTLQESQRNLSYIDDLISQSDFYSDFDNSSQFRVRVPYVVHLDF